MRRILLHIGTGKTGSSSIQASLSRAAREKTIGPIAYFRPQVESNNFIVALYKPFETLPLEITTRLKGADSMAIINLYRQELMTFLKANDRVIISAETLSTLKKEEVSLLKKDLNQAGYRDVKVSIYIRNPIEHYLSRMQQLIKTSTEILDPGSYEYRIRNRIIAWTNNFGSNVQVRPFDKKRLDNGCVVSDFIDLATQFMGFDLKMIKTHYINESLSAEGIIILNLYRKLFYPDLNYTAQADVEKLIDFLQRSKNNVRQTNPVASPTVKRLVAIRHNADLLWLQRNYGISFPGLLLEMNSSKEDPLFSNEKLSLDEVLAGYNAETVRYLMIAALKETLAEDKTLNP